MHPSSYPSAIANFIGKIFARFFCSSCISKILNLLKTSNKPSSAWIREVRNISVNLGVTLLPEKHRSLVLIVRLFPLQLRKLLQLQSRRRNIRLLDVATSRLSFYSVLCNEKRSHLNHQVCEWYYLWGRRLCCWSIG